MNRIVLVLQLAFNVVMLGALLFLVWPRRGAGRHARGAAKDFVAGPAAATRFEKLRPRAGQPKP